MKNQVFFGRNRYRYPKLSTNYIEFPTKSYFLSQICTKNFHFNRCHVFFHNIFSSFWIVSRFLVAVLGGLYIWANFQLHLGGGFIIWGNLYFWGWGVCEGASGSWRNNCPPLAPYPQVFTPPKTPSNRIIFGIRMCLSSPNTLCFLLPPPPTSPSPNLPPIQISSGFVWPFPTTFGGGRRLWVYPVFFAVVKRTWSVGFDILRQPQTSTSPITFESSGSFFDSKMGFFSHWKKLKFFWCYGRSNLSYFIIAFKQVAEIFFAI